MRTLLSFLVMAFIVVGCGSNNNPPAAPPPQPPPQGQPPPGQTGAWPQQSFQYMLTYCQQRVMNGYAYGASPQQAQALCSCYIGGLQQQNPSFANFINQLYAGQVSQGSQSLLYSCYNQAGLSYYGGSSCNFSLVYYQYSSW